MFLPSPMHALADSETLSTYDELRRNTKFAHPGGYKVAYDGPRSPLARQPTIATPDTENSGGSGSAALAIPAIVFAFIIVVIRYVLLGFC